MTNNIPLRIAVAGVTGRMGKQVIQCITYRQGQKSNNKIVLGAAIVKYKSEVCGIDISVIDQFNTSGIIITDDIKLVEKKFDILIDFTTPQATIEYLNFCVMHRKNMVIGTTGFDKNHLSLFKEASQKIGIVYSPNFSIGVAVMCRLLAVASKSIGSFFDIDIIENHHNKKNDVPSGTAVMMYDLIKYQLIKIESLFEKNDDMNYHNNSLKHELLHELSLFKLNRDIKIHSIRSGDGIGEHTVLFSGHGERLDITHKAFDRSIFANGALYSALWLKDKKTGLFDLNSVLGFDTYY